MAAAQTPGENVNMVSGTTFPGGDPFLQRQNEPSVAVSSRNIFHLLAGANDYRTVDLPTNDILPGEGGGDAWMGIFKSLDGGRTWSSWLLPGFPQDISPAGLASPLKAMGLSAAADAVIRPANNGLFYVSGIAFNRSLNQGVVFTARYMDLNNKENGVAFTDSDPIRYIDTSIRDSGNSGQFLDKPWILVGLPGTQKCTLQVPQTVVQNGVTSTQLVQQQIAAAPVYAVWSRFTGSNSTKIMFTRSLDCGATWSNQIKLSESNSVNQGTVLAMTPNNGNIYAAWRRFGTSSQPDAIVVVVSKDGGKTFSKAVDAVALPPFDPNNPGPSFFDQETSSYQFRTRALPTMAADASGRVYLFWSQRTAPYGDARIMVSGSTDGATWSTPAAVDNNPVVDDFGNTFPRGSQFMPGASLVGGKLMVVYYDSRLDHTLGEFDPNDPFLPDALGRFYRELRQPKGELPGDPGIVFTPFISDQNLTQRRHTLDVRVAQASPGAAPAFASAQVSRYKIGLRDDGGLTGTQTTLLQLQVDPPNLPLFRQGTAPFIGDYIDIAGQTLTPDNTGKWVPNTTNGSPVQWAVFTSNRDVRPPVDGDWVNYTPVGGGTQSVSDPTVTTPNCVPGKEGMRNQNIYSSMITQGLLAWAPQNAKQLSQTLQRGFAVFVQNQTDQARSFQVTIANQPKNGYASFLPAPNNPSPAYPTTPFPAPTTQLTLNIGAHSAAARMVFAFSSDPAAPITVNVNELNAPAGQTPLSSFVVLNADPTVPSLVNPDNSPADISAIETYDASISSATILDPNASISSASISSANISNASISSASISSANISSASISSTTLITGDIADASISSASISSANISSASISSASISSANISSTPVSDANYVVKNDGNTTASYTVQLASNGTSLPSNSQIIVTQPYLNPTSVNCELQNVPQFSVLTTVDSPQLAPVDGTDFSNPNLNNPNTISFQLPPGQVAVVTLRNGNITPQQMAEVMQNIVPVVTAQAPNTNGNTNSFTAPLLIKTTTSTLANATVGAPYSFQLTAFGGKAPLFWALASGSSLPAGITLAADGTLSGTPTTAGSVNFSVVLTDSSSTPVTLTAALTLVVNAASTTTTITSFNPEPSYVGQTFTANFTVAAVAPSTGTPTGTVTVSGAGTSCQATLPTSSCTLTVATVGTFSFTASYAGDGNYLTSTSAAKSHAVGKVPTTTTITSITPDPSLTGTPVTVNFTVASAVAGMGTPTGTVTVTIGGDAASCQATLPATSCTLTPTTAATSTFTATYSGDATFASSIGTLTHNQRSYTFTGFLSPLTAAGSVQNPPYAGTSNFGNAVPIKWQLTLGGTVVSDLSSTKLLAAQFNSNKSCRGAPDGAVLVLYQPTSGATGNSTFRFDANNNQFIFNWDTTSATAGCWTIELTLNDGSAVKAVNVQLTSK